MALLIIVILLIAFLLIGLYLAINHKKNRLSQAKPIRYAPVTPNSQQYQSINQSRRRRIHANPPAPPTPNPHYPTAKSPVNPPAPPIPNPHHPPANSPSTRSNAAIASKLIRLCGGDRKVAMRLVAHTRNQFPDRDEQWVWEKTCWDLERDRA
jgi:hypothetical protein